MISELANTVAGHCELWNMFLALQRRKVAPIEAYVVLVQLFCENSKILATWRKRVNCFRKKMFDRTLNTHLIFLHDKYRWLKLKL